MGINTPHEFLCDPRFFNITEEFYGEGIVIQFMYDFLGDKFFKLPENQNISNFILGAERGYCFFGETKKKIISIMLKMKEMNENDRLYSLFKIFNIFASTKEYKILSSPAFSQPFWQEGTGPMQKALKFILQNFQKQIFINDLLQITNMSNTAFYASFKATYRMTFKEYLLTIRVGYACKLLTNPSQSISSIAYESGFENISNFNRQFKNIKGITPSEFLSQIKNMEVNNKH
jgi:AraC-like DNA-binding protein